MKIYINYTQSMFRNLNYLHFIYIYRALSQGHIVWHFPIREKRQLKELLLFEVI